MATRALQGGLLIACIVVAALVCVHANSFQDALGKTPRRLLQAGTAMAWLCGTVIEGSAHG